MKFSLAYIFPAIASTLLFFSCVKDREDTTKMALMPNVLFYQFRENGAFLKEAALQDIEMFFIKNADTVNGIPWRNSLYWGVSLFQQTTADKFQDGPQHGVCGLESVSQYLKEMTNTFYFKFPDGNIDTLFLEGKDVSYDEGKKDPCICRYPLTTVLYNGKPAAINPNLKAPSGKPIFIFNKD